MAGQSRRVLAPSPDLAARLAAAIDDCAAALGDRCDAAAVDIAARLAATWALLTSADPELAARTAQYSGSA